MQSLISYGTFDLANTIAFGNQHFPTIEDGIPGFVDEQLQNNDFEIDKIEAAQKSILDFSKHV